MNNNNVNNNKKLVKQSIGGVFPVGNVPRRDFSGGQFSGGMAFSWVFLPEDIFPDDTLLTNSPEKKIIFFIKFSSKDVLRRSV